MITHMKLNCVNQLIKFYNFPYIVLAINSLDRYNMAQTLTIETLMIDLAFHDQSSKVLSTNKFYPS